MKFKVGDKVFISRNNCLGRGEVIKVDITCPDFPYYVRSVLRDDWCSERCLSLISSSPVPPCEQGVKELSQASKNDKLDNKVPLGNLRMAHIAEMCRVFEWAKAKYPDQENGDPNYYLGHSNKQLLAAVLRHTLAELDGEGFDPESGFRHSAHAMASLAMIAKQRELGTLKD